jgi:hypothetical protein
MTALHAEMPGKAKYISAHPESEMGNPNYSDRKGYELVAIQPNGVMIYRRKAWLRRVFHAAA